MGFTGCVLVGRLAGQELPTDLDGEVLHRADLVHGWQRLTIDARPSRPTTVVRHLAAESGAPALLAIILDSDCADLHAVTPDETHVHTYLHPAVAAEYGAPGAGDPETSTAGLVSWAHAGGLTPQPAGVRAAIEATSTFVEDTLDGLLQALGLDPSTGPHRFQPQVRRRSALR
jgi:hypothetical protein